MQDYVLTVLDTNGIQDYIFGSNTLRENIGASFLVEQVRRNILLEALPKGAHNLSFDSASDTLMIADQPLEEFPDHAAEVIYCGGGNIVVLFRDQTAAIAMVRELTCLLLCRAPGLEITAAHLPLPANAPFGGPVGAYNQLLGRLNQIKQQRRSSLPQPGLAVTLECRSTGLPAVAYDEPPDGEARRPVSAAIYAKSKTRWQANRRLRGFLRDIAQGYTFSGDFDDFGRTRGEASYIAVVHADGNGIGNRFQHLVDQFPEAGQNRDCINILRRLSATIEHVGRTALQQSVKQLVESMAVWKQDWPEDSEERRFVRNLQQQYDEIDLQLKPILPVRPLVFGGDDVTLVCDGRLGLPLAAAFLEQFEQASNDAFTQLKQWFKEQQIQLADQSVLNAARASAGVAIVKTHYPFRRAYDLAAALCDHVKGEIRKYNPDQSALDWHFATTGITAALADLRQRSYRTLEDKSLLMRPLALRAPGLKHSWRTWHNFGTVLDTLKNQEPWSGRRNKVIALREALRQGQDATQRYMRTYTIEALPEIPGGNTINMSGFADGHCGYFDAIEAIDLFLPLISLEQLAASVAVREVPA